MTMGMFFLIVGGLFAMLFLLVGLFNIWARRQPNHPRNNPRNHLGNRRMVDSGPDTMPFVPLFTPYGTAGDGGAGDSGNSFTGGGGEFGGGGADAGWSDSGGGDFGGGDSGGGGDGGGGGGD